MSRLLATTELTRDASSLYKGEYAANAQREELQKGGPPGGGRQERASSLSFSANMEVGKIMFDERRDPETIVTAAVIEDLAVPTASAACERLHPSLRNAGGVFSIHLGAYAHQRRLVPRMAYRGSCCTSTHGECQDERR